MTTLMNEPSASPTQALCSYLAATRFEGLPATVVQTTKTFVLDSLANVIGGAALTPAREIVALFEEMGGAPQATVLASGARTSVVMAAYVNSALANMLDFDDVLDAIGHPGATVIPPAFAVAEKTCASGAELINAIVAGYDVSVRVARHLWPSPERYKKVWGLSCWQTFGACAVTARLLCLDEEQTRNAMGVCGLGAPVPNARKLGLELEDRPFSWTKNNYGVASWNGVLAALLAARGFKSNRFIFDGERSFWLMASSDRYQPAKLTEALGERFDVMHTSLKPYASCRWTHTTVEAALRLATKGIAPDAVSTVTVNSFHEAGVSLATRRPVDIIDAQFSIPYLVALCLHGHSPATGLQERHLSDPGILKLADKVRIIVTDEANLLFEAGQMLSEVVVETSTGERLAETISIAKGDPTRPLGAAEIEDKFFHLVVPIVGMPRAQRIRDGVATLEHCPNVAEMVAAWWA
ncbi:MAG: MmgE/PrpD family protein [Betaproteobacteria bacterium]